MTHVLMSLEFGFTKGQIDNVVVNFTEAFSWLNSIDYVLILFLFCLNTIKSMFLS